MVAFDVCEDGVVRNVKVLRGVNAALDTEALRVINSSPKWEPGFQDGKPVKVTYQFPVIFQLQNNETALGPATNAVDPESGRLVQSHLKVSMENDPHDSVPFALVEQKPTFQGNDAATFAKWVAERLTYPKEAKDQKIQGRVMVAFDVCEDGVVRNVKVLRGVNPALDTEALRVINSSPKWEPGFQDGKPVKVTYQFPVVFLLKKDEQPRLLFIPVLRRPGFYRIIGR